MFTKILARRFLNIFLMIPIHLICFSSYQPTNAMSTIHSYFHDIDSEKWNEKEDIEK